MSEQNTGGPAFPTERNLTQGMTLRDYFAAKAMQALLSCAEWRENLDGKEHTPSEFTAFSAYEMADAMMKARKNV